MPDWYEEGRKQKLKRRVKVHITVTRIVFPYSGGGKKRKGRRRCHTYEIVVHSREGGKNDLHQTETALHISLHANQEEEAAKSSFQGDGESFVLAGLSRAEVCRFAGL